MSDIESQKSPDIHVKITGDGSRAFQPQHINPSGMNVIIFKRAGASNYGARDFRIF
jgi:hypothetical protein